MRLFFQSTVGSDILDYALLLLSSLHLNKHPCDGACIQRKERPDLDTITQPSLIVKLYTHYFVFAPPHICIASGDVG
jgi:hypothetical protein